MAQKSSSPFPLQTLLDLSHARLDDAARRLGQLLASEQASSQKLALLMQYREEYQTRFMASAQQGLSPEQWQNYRAFLAKLDEAIGQQQKALHVSRQRTADGQKAWLNQRTKAKAFDTLSERHKAAEVRQEGKREQRQTDEHAAKTYQRNQNDE